jgi:hypothetical protein
MQLAFVAAAGVAAVMVLAPQPSARIEPQHSTPAPVTSPDTALTGRVAGTWVGHRTASPGAREQQFRMVWHRAADGRLTGMVVPRGQPGHEVTAVWSSDTAFISESAPYMSRQLHERVVTRSVVYLKNGSLQGTFDTRPTRYEGRSLKGTFQAVRSS